MKGILLEYVWGAIKKIILKGFSCFLFEIDVFPLFFFNSDICKNLEVRLSTMGVDLMSLEDWEI